MRKLNAKWLRIARICGVVVFLFAAAAFIGTSTREVGLHLGNSNLIAIGNAAIQVGRNDGRVDSAQPRGLYTRDGWHTDWAVAWRPFHAKDKWSKSVEWHMLVLPLWPLIPIGAAIAAYAHGVLVGMRRARTSECQNCGYDLRKTPVVNGKRTCPECGVATVIAATGGTPAQPDAI